MSLKMDVSQLKNCPRCGNHCPVGALKCDKGRKYFSLSKEKDHERGQTREIGGQTRDKLSKLLHRCGRFVRHAELEAEELYQPLTGEERDELQALLEKLSAGWEERYGEEALSRHGGKHRKHRDHDK